MTELSEIRSQLDRLEASLAELKSMLATSPASPPQPTVEPHVVAAQPVPAPPSVATPPVSPVQPVAAPPAPTSPPAPLPPLRAPLNKPSQPPAQPHILPANIAPAPSRAPIVQVLDTARSLEARLLGNWFARLGALAILFGLGFGFKYAVDRDLISPAARVGLGLAAGLAFVAWAEWARSRDWQVFAQAVAGGGIAIMYLSIWAGYQLYDLWSPILALVLLGVVTVGGAMLALRYDSMALAVLASLGGFLNPLLVSTGRGWSSSLSVYLLVLDLGVATLAYRKGWRPLNVLALCATWFLVLFSAESSELRGTDDLVALALGCALFALFEAVFLREAIDPGDRETEVDLLCLAGNTAALTTLGFLTLERTGAEALFCLLLGTVNLLVAIACRRRNPENESLLLTTFLLGAVLVALASELWFDGPVLNAVRSIEAAALVAVSTRRGFTKLTEAGILVFGLSIVYNFFYVGLGLYYEPDRVILSPDALPFVTQIVLITAGSIALSRGKVNPKLEVTAKGLALAAHVLTVVWLSFEVAAYYRRDPFAGIEDFTFALSTLWTAYAAGLLVFGIARRAMWARLSAVFLLGLVLVKLVVVDVWLLPIGLRIVAFIGLGFVLLLSSQLYHRFKALIFGPDPNASPALDNR